MDQADYPALQARTRRFTLGRPRDLRLSHDGRRALFLRAAAGDEPRTSLWSLDTATGDERLLADAAALDADELPDEERARRERVRETAAGVVAYATDPDARVAVFALAGGLWRVDVDGGAPVRLDVAPGAFDPRPAPDGDRVAYVADGRLRLVDPDGDRELAGGDGASWGVAEFVAAEEMGRLRGHWWAPDGRAVAACRVDESAVARWWIADPSRPDRPPAPHLYPAAGSSNAEVRLFVLEVDGDGRVEVRWDRDRHPYLAAVRWERDAPLTLAVQSRDQREVAVLAADPSTGATSEVAMLRDPDWIDLVPGTPAWSRGRLVTVEADRDHDAHRLVVEGRPVTPTRLQVRAVAAATAGGVVFTASGDDPTAVAAFRWTDDGGVEALGAGADHRGVTTVAAAAADVHAEVRADLDGPPEVAVVAPQGRRVVRSRALAPPVAPTPRLLELGARGLRGALLLPTDRGDARLPVLLDPYGGPHVQRVVRSRDAFLTPQWFADQGFAVLVVDGRGTPGRGPAWERAVRGDLARRPLEDQVEALRAAARVEPRLDLDRVAVRGWSFGGFLAAVAVTRRPDVFRAGIAGAPVADWRLYDTHYTERYLGRPDEDPEAYRRSSVVDDGLRLVDAAPDGRGDLLVIHGLADDNVVAAHALRLSSALLAQGWPHRFLPLSGVTHMTPQETVARRLLEIQVAFLRDALG